MTIGRNVINVTQKARGKEPLKYELEVIPITAWEIPDGIDKLLFCWERGTKLYVTETADVRPNRAVFFKQFLKQQCTMYRDSGGHIAAKEFSFKLQTVKGSDRKTVAKVHVDMAPFCEGQINPRPVEKTFTLKPWGKLKVSIRASWLKNAKIDVDAMTEASGAYTEGSGRQRKGGRYDEEGEEEEEEEEEYEERGKVKKGRRDEQDLSGFGEEEGASSSDWQDRNGKGKLGGKQHSRKKSSRMKGQLPDQIPEDEEAPPAAEEDDEEHKRIKREKREKRRQQRMLRERQEQPGEGSGEGADMGTVNLDVGLRIQKKTWRDYVCCCCSVRTKDPPVLAHEEASLLNAQQKMQMQMRNKL